MASFVCVIETRQGNLFPMEWSTVASFVRMECTFVHDHSKQGLYAAASAPAAHADLSVGDDFSLCTSRHGGGKMVAVRMSRAQMWCKKELSSSSSIP